MEEVLRAKAKEGSKETAIEVVHEEIEVVVEEREARAFYSNKGVETFEKYLAKKSFVEERGFKELVSLLKEEIEQRG